MTRKRSLRASPANSHIVRPSRFRRRSLSHLALDAGPVKAGPARKSVRPKARLWPEPDVQGQSSHPSLLGRKRGYDFLPSRNQPRIFAMRLFMGRVYAVANEFADP